MPDSLTSINVPSNAWRLAISKGLQAARANRWPGVAMWLFGISLIGGYYWIPAVHEALEAVGRFKAQYGWRFSMISTGIFGGLIPAWLQLMLPTGKTKATWGLLLASTLLWAYKGIEIDMFYHFQAWVFGFDSSLLTIAKKTFCDQLLWVPAVGMVNVVLFYMWRDCRYSVTKLWGRLQPGWYQRRVMPVLIANWFIWIPAVAMIYGLPIALQLPVQNLILCFWVLILMFFTESDPE